MADDLATCVICHETMEKFHHVVKPNECDHTFHAICINVWLARHRSCPLCRCQISVSSQAPWRALFMTALMIGHDTAIERACYTYTFLSLILRRFSTAEQWSENKQTIITAAEQFEIGTTRLPFLDLTSRSAALSEKKKWYKYYIEISGEAVQNSERIGSARRWILDQYAFLFDQAGAARVLDNAIDAIL